MHGNFSHTSRNITLDGHVLRAECKDEHGNWVHSELDLDTCIGNLDGKYSRGTIFLSCTRLKFLTGYLAWDCVNFTHTTKDIKLVEGGTKIEGTLTRVAGGPSAPQGIYLNQRITNKNGKLIFSEFNTSHLVQLGNSFAYGYLMFCALTYIG